MDQQTLTVKGTGRESLKPDQILITCTLSAKDTDYNALTSPEVVGFGKKEAF